MLGFPESGRRCSRGSLGVFFFFFYLLLLNGAAKECGDLASAQVAVDICASELPSRPDVHERA